MAAQVVATNLLTDPSFEYGIGNFIAIATATSASDTARARSGTRSLKVTRTADDVNAAVRYAVLTAGALKAGTTYTFAAYVWVPSSNAAEAQTSAYVIRAGDAGVAVPSNSPQPAAVDSWQRIAVTFTTTATSGNVTLYVFGPQTSGNVCWYDDMTLTEGAVAPGAFSGDSPTSGGYAYRWTGTPGASASQKVSVNATTTNLFPDPGFEYGRGGWVSAPDASVVLSNDTTVKHSGSQSLKVVTPGLVTQEGAYFSPTLFSQFRTGDQCVMTGWVRMPAGVPFHFYATSLGTASVPGTVNTTGTGDWQFISATATVGDQLKPYLLVRTTSTTATTFWLDDVSLNAPASFSGDTPIDGTYTYRWTGAAGNSASQRVALGGASLQSVLQQITGTKLSAQGAANKWAGTTGLDLLGALNAKAGTKGVGYLKVLNQLAACDGTAGEQVCTAAILAKYGG